MAGGTLADSRQAREGGFVQGPFCCRVFLRQRLRTLWPWLNSVDFQKVCCSDFGVTDLVGDAVPRRCRTTRADDFSGVLAGVRSEGLEIVLPIMVLWVRSLMCARRASHKNQVH